MVSSAAPQPAAPTAQPSPGSLFATIRATLPALIPSERRVAEVCLRRADEVADWSAAQLAAAAEVSAATVVRACQSMGFRGFQQLRVAFAREAGAYFREAEAGTAGTRAPLREPRAGDPPNQIVDTVFELGRAVLADSLTALDRDQVALAVDLLDGARRLLVVGNGGSAPVAQDAALRFLSVGRSVEAPADAQTQQLAAAGLSEADACLLITGSGVNELTFRVATIARERGASIVLMTSYAAGPVAGLASATLVVGVAHWPLGSDTIGSRLPSLLLVNALQLAVGLRREGAPGTSAEEQRKLLGTMIIGPDEPATADED
ncbi:MurR/RpiR family transcriptional regulator [Pseudofrankia inefficax]|uniref:Transcriptional regulator, RpiR family n=1 Tax=Pseudofrankia inefficax (strain DSM 45817 / CECT 9037 / DDB 130130 / EuI1c) TaxID=298654 RepID=E3IY91_PSEI1|nr:MurR/RpiR family transcriptional regulator [Pseudofrankia inefficax]ADP82689.1 transcriptional regulator, RpiR family [Pseudofrankia inefficax]